jgi:uncharacterized membrane-anchored protein YitT (DUF2179 family)
MNVLDVVGTGHHMTVIMKVTIRTRRKIDIFTDSHMESGTQLVKVQDGYSGLSAKLVSETLVEQTITQNTPK